MYRAFIQIPYGPSFLNSNSSEGENLKPGIPKAGHPGAAAPASPSRFGATARSWLGNLLVFVAFLGLLSIKVIYNAGLSIPVAMLISIVVGIAAIWTGMFGRHLAMTGRKQRAVLASRAASLDPRAPVLYLRSFADDEKVAEAHQVNGFIQLSTEEEQFAKVFRRIGPFVAIGRPREKLPTLGATRFYAGDDEWRTKVDDLLSTARLVILRLSPTEGLLWELKEVVSRVEPNRLLLFLPNNYKYEPLKSLGEQWLPKPLPNLPGRRTAIGTLRGIVRFRADWSSEFVPARFSWLRVSLRSPISPHLQLMLRPVFNQLGVPWSKPRVGTLSIIFILMAFFAVITVLRIH